VKPNLLSVVASIGVAFVVLVWCGCRGLDRKSREAVAPPPPGFEPTALEYVDADGFDALLESTLINQEPAISIRTGHAKPEWGARLNAWIAAWNRGGQVGDKPRTARSQTPILPTTVDAASLREFRLLIEGLMDRVEGAAREQSAWWAEKHVRDRRVALLRPYNLRFHRDADDLIQLILFNGQYPDLHREFVKATVDPEMEVSEEWSRMMTCSLCRK
jgi:hypothetical protein